MKGDSEDKVLNHRVFPFLGNSPKSQPAHFPKVLYNHLPEASLSNQRARNKRCRENTQVCVCVPFRARTEKSKDVPPWGVISPESQSYSSGKGGKEEGVTFRWNRFQWGSHVMSNAVGSSSQKVQFH